MGKFIKYKTDEATYYLAPLNDTLYTMLDQQSVMIRDDSSWQIFQIEQSIERQGGKPLQLGQFYFTLKLICKQDTSRVRDTWKSAFLFPFLLTGTWKQQGLLYLFYILNYRSSVEMRLRRLMPFDHDKREHHIIHEPFAHELPQEAIRNLCAFMYGYIEGYHSSISKAWFEPFYCCVGSNLILLGYQDDEFFEWQFDDYDEYKAALQKLQQRHGYDASGE